MILPSPTAPEGSVATLASYSPSDFPATSAVLCRNTAPLISFAFSLLHRSIPCRVLGREIGQGLIILIEKLKPKDLPDLDTKLQNYEATQRKRFLARFDEASAEAVSDRVRCIEIFLSESESLTDLTSRITALFADNVNGKLTLSTIHKSKGLEWPLVFQLDFFELLPSKFAKQPWQRAQEENLAYVARTRAQIDLRYIKSGNWKEEKPQTKEEKLLAED